MGKNKLLNVLRREYVMSISYELSHIWKFIASSLAGIITTILFSMLWFASTDLGYGGLSKEYVISYFFLVLIVSKLTIDVSIKLVTGAIVTGNFAKYMLRPFNYLTEAIAANLAEQTIQTLFVLPVIAVGGYFLSDYLVYDITPYTVFLFLLAIGIANILKFLMAQIFSLIAFTVKQIYGLRNLHENMLYILSGEIIPYASLPLIIISILELSPFRYLLSFPIEILIGGMRPYDLRIGFIISIIWIIVLYLIYKIGYAINIKKYEAEGI